MHKGTGWKKHVCAYFLIFEIKEFEKKESFLFITLSHPIYEKHENKTQ